MKIIKIFQKKISGCLMNIIVNVSEEIQEVYYLRTDAADANLRIGPIIACIRRMVNHVLIIKIYLKYI